MSNLPVVPPAVRWIVKTLEDAGHETWTVGGAVRDARLGLRTGDWDLATRATPKQVRRVFRRTVPIGIEHGTVGVLAKDGTLYEVTTFRRDVETDGRHAVVEFADTLEEDLARRDFTINAIAWHPIREELFDPFDGTGDLKRSLLRTVGRPEDRFAEDYLRVLRALRFAGAFDLEIDSDTWSALRAAVDQLGALSAERVRDELLKILEAQGTPARSLDLYAESGALAVLYPEWGDLLGRPVGPREGALTEWSLANCAINRLPPARPLLRLAALLRPVDPTNAAALLMRLRISNLQVDETARVAAAAALPGPDEDDAAFRRWLSRHGVARLPAISRVALSYARAEAELGLGDRVASVVASWSRARRVRASDPPLDVSDLAIDGRDLIGLGLRPGPHFGKILEQMLDWVLEDPVRNEPDVLRARVTATSGTGL